MAELAATSGVSVPTIKFYLREGLLPPGERTSATQATYDHSHVSRLQLIRALVGVGGLSIAKAKQVLAVHDQPPADIFEAVGTAQVVLEEQVPDPVDLDEARALVESLGWHVVHPEGPDLQRLASALEGLRLGDIGLVAGGVAQYAAWIEEIARAEIDTIPTDDPGGAIRQSLLGTILIEPLLLALRRLAHQSISLDRLTEHPETAVDAVEDEVTRRG